MKYFPFSDNISNELVDSTTTLTRTESSKSRVSQDTSLSTESVRGTVAVRDEGLGTKVTTILTYFYLYSRPTNLKFLKFGKKSRSSYCSRSEFALSDRVVTAILVNKADYEEESKRGRNPG